MNINKSRSFSANQSSFFVPAANYTHPDIFTKLVQHESPFSKCNQCQWSFDKSFPIFKDEKDNYIQKIGYKNMSDIQAYALQEDYGFEYSNPNSVFVTNYVVDTFTPDKSYSNSSDVFAKSDDNSFVSNVEKPIFLAQDDISDREITLPVENNQIFTSTANDDFFVADTNSQPVLVNPVANTPVNAIPENGSINPSVSIGKDNENNPINEIGSPVESPKIKNDIPTSDNVSILSNNSPNVIVKSKTSSGYDWIPFIIASATILGFIYFGED